VKLATLKNPNVVVGIFFFLYIAAAIFGLIQYVNLDTELKDPEKIKRIENEFRQETKLFSLPPKTAINKEESLSKETVIIGFKTRYRTELDDGEFRDYFHQKMADNGWRYYRRDESDDPFVWADLFCKSKFDAELLLERGNIWGDEAHYYQLRLSFGNRRWIHSNTPIPEACKG
jgi:hypothetical protein